MWLLDLILYGALAYGLYYVWTRYYRGIRFPENFFRGKIVFVSGCDSGFGEKTSVALYKQGFRVFSACLTDQGVQNLHTQAAQKKLSTGGSITAFKCDITKDEDVTRAHEEISKACAETGEGVWAIINNAGIGVGGPVEWVPLSQYTKVFEVNFFGHVRVTKAFLPLIRKSKGRVVNVTSMAGTIAIPHMSAYAATKHALEAFNNSLRRELEYFGCYVVCIAPTFMKTNIIGASLTHVEAAWNALSPAVQKEYDPQYFEMLKARNEQYAAGAEPPQIVVDSIVDAVTLQHPPPKFSVGKGALFLEYCANILPAIIFDFIFVTNIRALKKKLNR